MTGFKSMTMVAALNEALDIALSADPDVFLIGEDLIDPVGGSFGVTKGLSTKYGRERVRETPISEQAIIGAAIGSAITGGKPVAEIMIADFYAVCMDQIANHAAKLRYMSGGRTTVPMVVRGLFSGGLNFAAQHSQSLEAWMAHVPGLKVAMPSNPANAKALLLAAIDDPDPVVFMEPAALYNVTGEVPVGEDRIRPGTARIVRSGTDVTVIAYGPMVPVAVAVADRISTEISVEIIDLQWIVPWDTDTVMASVTKTRRAVIAHQAVQRAGFGAEIAATIQEQLFETLAAPILRVAGKNTPVPFATALEQEHMPGPNDLEEAIRKVVKLT
ncbi:alpha-ketoacid dehydrogenase subunit beta [Rhodococcus sp. WS4]|nr:alpha-ketoacid dehydrogenase subunit beta [Rhodococcus sp. WS4]